MFATLNDKSMHCQSKRKAFIDLSNIPSDDETAHNFLKCTTMQDMSPTKTDKENHISRSISKIFIFSKKTSTI